MAQAPQSGGDHAEWRPKANPWLIAISVTLAAFMEVLDTTIVNVSLPHIAGDLSSTYDDATWALTAYLVANGIVLTVSGWIGRLLGRKRYFLICIAMFTVFSFLCGAATSLPELIIFRLMQGFFGGGLQPNQQSIILDTFPPAKRGAAFGVTALATIVAPALGPTLGGYITDNASWRWVFYINVPIGIFALIANSALVEDPPWAKKQAAPLDVIGLSLITIGLGCLQVLMDRGEDDDWFGSPFIRWMAVGAVLGIGGAIVWLLNAKRPVVNLRVFKDRNFALGTISIATLGFVLYSTAVLVPQFAQQVLGYTATLAGLVLSPGALAILVLIPFIGRLMKVVQTRMLIAFGFTVMGTAMVISSYIPPDVDFRTLVICRILQAGCLAFLFVPISTIGYSTIPREMNGDASALFAMVRNVFGSIGISTATAVIQEGSQIRQANMAHWMSPYRAPYNAYLDRAKQAYLDAGMPSMQATTAATAHLFSEFRKQATILAYHDAYLLFGIAALTMVPVCMLFGPMVASGKPGSGGH